MARLNHTWKTVSKFESVCTRCDCERTKDGFKVGGKWSSVYYYTRSKIFFGMKYPECLNWDDDTLD